MSAPVKDRPGTVGSPLDGLDVREYGQLVASRYAARDAFGRVTRPNLVIWAVAPISDSGPVNPATVAVLMPLTDEELALLDVSAPRFSARGVRGQERAKIRAAARRGISLTGDDAPHATLDWSGVVTGAVLNAATRR